MLGERGGKDWQDKTYYNYTYYRLQHILSDGVDNALAGGPQALPLSPAHLLEQLEALVLGGEFVLLHLTGWLGCSASPSSAENLNSL